MVLLRLVVRIPARSYRAHVQPTVWAWVVGVVNAAAAAMAAASAARLPNAARVTGAEATRLWALGSGLWALGSGLWALGSGLWALGSHCGRNYNT
jgi:hypothetical protein